MTKRFYAYAISLFIVVATVFALNTSVAPSFAAVDTVRDCDQTAIITCGVMTQAELTQKYTANAAGDLPAVYRTVGISSASDLTGYVDGVIYKDGRVFVGDKLVATGAQTAVRNMGGSAISGSKAGYIATTATHWAGEKPAYVKMVNGRFAYAIIKTCGNPVKATPVAPTPVPSAACSALTATKISRTDYKLTATATTKDGATISSYIFTVTGPASYRKTITVTSAAATATTAVVTLTTPGTYTASVVVKTSVGDRSGTTCQTTITVPEDSKPGVTIDKKVDALDHKTVNVDQVFTYTIVVSNTGNTALKNVTVSDNEPAGVSFISVAPSGSGTISNGQWKYLIPSLAVGETRQFAITAKVPRYVATAIKNTACVDTPDITGASPDACDDATVDVPAPSKIVVCNPSTGQNISVDETEKDSYKPVGDEACKPKVLPVVTTTPHTPATVASTGPVDVVASVAGVGSLTAAGYYFQASRRHVLSRLLNK